MPESLKKLCRIEEQGDGAIVLEGHLHVGLKDPGFAMNAQIADRLDEVIVEWARNFRSGGRRE